jgi:hypothetical protein
VYLFQKIETLENNLPESPGPSLPNRAKTNTSIKEKKPGKIFKPGHLPGIPGDSGNPATC